MPWIQHSDYQAPYWLFNGHLQTIIPSQFRKVQGVNYVRERFATPDNDFLLLDWCENQSDKLAIISHGLEGDSHRPYIKGMVRAFVRDGWDTLAWNFRGCGGEINHTLRFYHSGATDDLDLVISHAVQKNKYKSIVLVGFSLGGNLTLKYLGESAGQLIPNIKAGVVFSVPLDLHSCSTQISEPSNFIYNQRFLKNLKLKVRQKVLNMPEVISTEYFDRIRTLQDFDEFYTAPLHGFKDAVDYYSHCSSLYFLNDIDIPTLIVNAVNDPFLSDLCYPKDQLSSHPHVFLEAPPTGGHVGFMPRGVRANQNFWSEDRAVSFANSRIKQNW